MSSNRESGRAGSAQLALSLVARTVCMTVGVLVIAAGVAAVLLSRANATASILVIAGVVLLIIGSIGIIPMRVGVAGSEIMYMEATREQLASSLKDTGSPIEARQLLSESVLAVDEQVRQTGRRLPKSTEVLPSLAYTTTVEAALKRCFPGQHLSHWAGNSYIDFTITFPDGPLYVMTGFSATGKPMPEPVVDLVIKTAAGVSRLLVVTNKLPTDTPYEMTHSIAQHGFFDTQILPGNLIMVAWVDEQDDQALKTAVNDIRNLSDG